MRWDTTLVVRTRKSRAERARSSTEIFYGQRPVQVDQSYLDQLHQLVDYLRSTSDFNYDQVDKFYAEALDWKGKAEQFHGEALYWRGRALAAEADAKALQAQLAERDAALAQAQAALAAERAAPSNDPRRKVGPQPLPADGDLADRGAYRRPKRPTGIRRTARHGQGRHRRDRARRTFPRLPRRAGEKSAA